MSDNPSARKIRSRLEQIYRLQQECISIFIEHPTCLETEREKEEMIALAISYIEAKLKRTKAEKTSYANAQAIYLSIAVQEFEEASGDYSKKQSAKRVTLKLLERPDAALMIIPDEIKESAFAIAKKYLAEL